MPLILFMAAWFVLAVIAAPLVGKVLRKLGEGDRDA